MVHNNKEVLDYWNNQEIESMYDKNLINLEIKIIKTKINENSKILDAGCGEGEATLEYSKIKGVFVKAVDFSDTRLEKARNRLSHADNVSFAKVDFLSNYELDKDFDYVISQRFIINLMDWDLQKKVILDLMKLLKTGGKLLLLEGSQDGVEELNYIRELLGLDPIDVKWHNLFLRNNKFESFIKTNGYRVIEKDGMGDYFLLTRGIRPFFEKDLHWDTVFNKTVSSLKFKTKINMKEKFSRLVLWVIEKT